MTLMELFQVDELEITYVAHFLLNFDWENCVLLMLEVREWQQLKRVQEDS